METNEGFDPYREEGDHARIVEDIPHSEIKSDSLGYYVTLPIRTASEYGGAHIVMASGATVEDAASKALAARAEAEAKQRISFNGPL